MRSRFLATTTAVLSVMLLAACGSDDEGDTTTSASGGSTTESSSGIVAEAQKNVETYFSNGSVAPPDTGPAAAADKKVVLIDAGTATPSGAEGARSAEEAGELLGWDVSVFDGKFTPATQQEGIRQAISQKADGIVLYGVDCPAVKAALGEARDAGVKVVGVSSQDCSDGGAGESLFDSTVLYPPLPGSEENLTGFTVWGAYGAAQADWVISQTDGKAKVILFEVLDFAVTAELARGFRDRIKECSECEIVDAIELGVNDFGPAMQDLGEQALLRNPDANAFNGAYADPMSLGLAPAIVAAGKAESLAVVAGTDNTDKLELVREGKGLNAGFVQIITWDIFSGMDQLNRLFAGEEPAVNGQAVTMFDEEHNVPPSGPFVPDADYKGTFEAIWNGEG